jgi:hypothetical protein
MAKHYEIDVSNGKIILPGGGQIGGGLYTNTASIIKPPSDSTSSIKITKADGATSILSVDTLNTRVGIGTIAPAVALDIVGSTNMSGSLNVGKGVSTGNASIQLGDGRTGDGYAYVDFIGDTTYSDYGFRIIRNNTGVNAISSILHRGTSELQIVAAEVAPIRFYTTNLQRMEIDSAGKVGINCSPGATFHVNCVSTSNIALNFGGTVAATGSQNAVLINAGSTLKPAQGYIAYGYSTGGVSIDTSLGNCYLRIMNLDGSSYTKAGANTITDAYSLQVSAPTIGTTNYAIYSVSGSNYFGGSVGIAGAPSYRLDVVGGAGNGVPAAIFRVDNNSGINFVIQRDGGGAGTVAIGASSNHNLSLIANNAEKMNIGAGGTVYIPGSLGLGVSPGCKLYVYESTAVGGTAGNSQDICVIRGVANNAEYLTTKLYRHTTGSDWTGVAMRIQHTVDSSPMAFIDFNPTSTSSALAIGSNNTIRMTVNYDGRVGIGAVSSADTLSCVNASADPSILVGCDQTNKFIRMAYSYSANMCSIQGGAWGGTARDLCLQGGGGNLTFGAPTPSYGGGGVVIFIANATTVPTSNPSGGGILYVSGGALKFRGSSGTVTNIANA